MNHLIKLSIGFAGFLAVSATPLCSNNDHEHGQPARAEAQHVIGPIFHHDTPPRPSPTFVFPTKPIQQAVACTSLVVTVPATWVYQAYAGSSTLAAKNPANTDPAKGELLWNVVGLNDMCSVTQQCITSTLENLSTTGYKTLNVFQYGEGNWSCIGYEGRGATLSNFVPASGVQQSGLFEYYGSG